MYNRGAESLEKYKITSHVEFDDSLILFESVDYTIECEESYLTFLSDVMSNSLHHHIREKVKEKPSMPLNVKSTIEGYSLSETVFFCPEDSADSVTSFSDLVYRRKKI